MGSRERRHQTNLATGTTLYPHPPALVRTLLSVRRAEDWKTTLRRHFKLITDNEIYGGGGGDGGGAGGPWKLLNRLLYGSAEHREVKGLSGAVYWSCFGFDEVVAYG